MLIRFYENVIANLFATLLVFLTGMGASLLLMYFKNKHPLRQILGFEKTSGVDIVLGAPTRIIPGTTRTGEGHGVPLTPIGIIFAFHRIARLLTQAYPKLKNIGVYSSTDFPNQQYDRNLVLIGFPRANQVTQEIMQDMQLPLVFDGHALVDSTTREVVYQALVEGDEVKEDYGCLIRGPNPYHRGSAIFILAGCQTYGVKAAADFLSSQNVLALWDIHVPLFFRRLASKLVFLVPRERSKLYYEAVVKVKVRQHLTSEPELVFYRALETPGGQ